MGALSIQASQASQQNGKRTSQWGIAGPVELEYSLSRQEWTARSVIATSSGSQAEREPITHRFITLE
jgi:hypothetical protein